MGKDEGQEITRASLELLYEVGREFAAALDLRTVLHRVLFLSMKHVGATSGSIIVLDERGQPVESAFLMHGQSHDQTLLQLRVTYERGMAGWVARNRLAVLVTDTSRDERWLRRPDDAEDRSGSKSAISVPVLAHEDLVGVITLVHPKPGFYTPDHLELVQAIADQAGIAVLNARLYAESQHQTRVMTAVAESAAVINASLNLDVVLRRILEQISQALQVEGASLALIDQNRGQLEFHASTFENDKNIIGMRVPMGDGILGWAAQEGQGVVAPDVRKDGRFSPAVDREYRFKRRAVMCAPIRSEAKVIGVLEVVNPLVGEFDADDLSLLVGIGNMAGTAIRHAQLFESLQAAHQRYQELFQDSIDPILITDLQGVILEANNQAESMVGVESNRLTGLSIGSLHEIDQEKLGPGFERLLDGDTFSYESVLKKESGREIPLEVHVRTVDSDNAPCFQWIWRDITERKDLDSLREDLIAMIYHDLRSPLANVVSSLEVLSSIVPDDNNTNITSVLNIAMRSTDRIQRLTNSLLDINRLEAGQMIGDTEPVAPYVLVEDAFDAVRLPVANKDLAVELAVSTDLPMVFVDIDMIQRVIINLLENAVKFTPAKGKITVGAEQDTEFVYIWIQDTGPGIQSADRGRIFEKFTRLNVKDGSRHGLGLGLAFCRLAVVGHGGKIWVEGEGQTGAKFIFSLPR